MTGLGQSLRDPQSLMILGKPRGNIPGSECVGVELRCRPPDGVSLGLPETVPLGGAWNVLSRREDDHLSLLSSELKRLDISIAALSGVRRPDCGEIMAGGYTYYWYGRSDGYHAQGVAVAVSNNLTPMIIKLR